MAEKGEDVSLVHLHVEVVHCFEALTVYLAQVFQFEKGLLCFLVLVFL